MVSSILRVSYCYLHTDLLILVLINYLRVHVKTMYWLYCILKDCEESPTSDEIAFASGKKKLDGNTKAEYFKKLQVTSEKH